MRNLFLTEIIIELSYTRGYAPLRRLLHKRRKVRVFVWKGIRKISFLTIPLPSQLIPQPRRRSVRSHSVLLVIRDRRRGKFECTERIHMTSRRPYWCSKTMKRRPYWCSKQILWD